MAEIKFKRDTAFRKQFFVPDSFAHPAKMDAQLLMWIVLKYSEAGETILDPMAGSGTTMLACNVGRDVILVELEEKFCKMMRDNWGLVKMKPQLGCQMGTCQIIQGDARNLAELLTPRADIYKYKLADKIITSPPYTETLQRWGKEETILMKRKGLYQESKNGIGNLPYGDIDSIITSPPYGSDNDTRIREDLRPNRSGPLGTLGGDNPQNIGNKPYGDIDSIITSPPYEGICETTHASLDAEEGRVYHDKRQGRKGTKWEFTGQKKERYSDSKDNIGNLKSDTYLSAMLTVYQQCFKVLKDGGLMILVTKNFIRNKKVVRLDTDTIKLCEQAGFSYVERHWRKLPAQSFWRIIYHKKHPEVEQIRFEDVLVFKKWVMELND